VEVGILETVSLEFSFRSERGQFFLKPFLDVFDKVL